MMKYEDHIGQLLLKFSRNRCTHEERVQLLQYFKENPNVELMPEIRRSLKSETAELSEDTEMLYAGILSKIHQKQNEDLLIKRKNPMFYFAAVAAIFIAALGAVFYFQMINPKIQPEQKQEFLAHNDEIVLDLGEGKKEVLSETGNLVIADKEGQLLGGQKGNMLIYQKQESASNEIAYNTLSVPYGKQFEIQLSDGSIVHMNAGSSLRYPVRFPKQGNRQVYLTGEAFFKVAKDEQQPFIVEAENLQISVLGTEFNVSAYPEDLAKSVVLIEGSVDVGSTDESGERVILKPGQLGSLNRGAADVEILEVDAEIYTSWLDGELVFKDLTFDNILKKMERHYNVKIINNNLSLANVKFNARFKNEEIVDILNYFETVYGLSFMVGNENSIVINP